MKAFWLCFIPLFVAVDPMGLVPVFVSVTGDLDPRLRRRLVLQATPTALAIGLVFFAIGRPLLSFLHIGVPDLQIAGGILLFIYAVVDLFFAPGKPSVSEAHSMGTVPLATPLIVGPAVLTAGLVLVDRYSYASAALALIANIVLLTLALLGLEWLLRWIPLDAMRAVSKVVDLLLAAIGVGFVRWGILAAIGH